MSTFTAVKNKAQGGGAIGRALDYVEQEKKTLWEERQLVTGWNCVAQSAYDEMMTTKRLYEKTDGRMFYQFVQSFDPAEEVTPEEVHAIGLELAQRLFPEYEVVVATHVDTEHLHSHLIVNSVSCVNGRKLHQNAADLQRQRQVNDEICMAHGLSVLEPPQKHSRKKQMRPGEYQAGLRGNSRKLDLIHTINEALEYVDDRESFIEFMGNEGYQVIWADNRKHITFICPNGRKCRDSSLHDETFLKENLEALFVYRQATGFRPVTLEPDEGWMGELVSDWLRVGKYLEQNFDVSELPAPPTWTDSKQRRRETIKKLAMGQKLSGDQQWEQRM